MLRAFLKIILPRTTLVVASLLISFTAAADSRVEAAQLDYVALDATVDCNRILFRSSRQFKNTLFVIPRVVPGIGVEGARTYNLTPSVRPGIYNLSINLYFPANDEVVKSNATFSASSTKKDLLACNWDHVKHSLNKDTTDLTQQIQTISRIPLTSVDVRIPGIKHVGMIGRSLTESQNPDILDYYGKSLTVLFEITEREKQVFQAQLVSKQGIPAQVIFRFQARSRDGSIHASVNVANIMRNFTSHAAVKGMKFIGSADLALALQDSLNGTSIQVTSEAGSNSEALASISNLIIDKVLKEVQLIATNPEKQTKDQGELQAPAKGMVSIQAALNIIKGAVQSEISYTQIAAPMAATAQTEVRLWTDRINDPNVNEVVTSAGYTDPSTGLTLNAGQTIVITPTYWYTDEIKYTASQKYLTTSDLLNLSLANYFPDLLNESVKVANNEINGTLLAEGRWNPMSVPMAWAVKMRWLRLSYEAERLRKESNLFQPGLENLSSIPVAITFSELGDTHLFYLHDLMNTSHSALFSAQYHSVTGRIFLTANRDLGTLRFRQRIRGKDELKYSEKPQIVDQVHQVRVTPFSSGSYVHTQNLKVDPRPIILQKTIVFYVRNPQKLNVDAIINGKQSLPGALRITAPEIKLNN